MCQKARFKVDDPVPYVNGGDDVAPVTCIVRKVICGFGGDSHDHVYLLSRQEDPGYRYYVPEGKLKPREE